MDRERTIKALEWIKNLFFRSVIAREEGMITHYADCEVHRPVSIYNYAPCTCGLNYHLRTLDGIAEKLNPNYGLEYRKQEVGIDFVPPSQEKMEEMDKVLEQVFGPLNRMTPEERAAQDEEEWSIIAEVFGDDYVQYLKDYVNDRECEVCRNEWCSRRYQQCPWCREMGSGRTDTGVQRTESGSGCCHSEAATSAAPPEEG